jgi:hypothetical protein
MLVYTYIEYARFADDLVILIDAYKRHDWLVGAVDKRLREEFGKLQVEINDEKSRTVDLERGECFGFLGFEFRYLRGLSGAMRPHYTPKLKKRTALVRALKGGEGLIHQERALDRTGHFGQYAPVGAELEGHYDSGYNAQSERYTVYFQPEVEEHAIDRAAGRKTQRLEHGKPRGQSDGEGWKDGELNSRQ